MTVMSVVRMNPRKLGSFEEYTIALSRQLTRDRGKSIVVFTDSPPADLMPFYRDSGAILETKPFGDCARASARCMLDLIRRYRPDLVHLHFVSMFSFDVIAAGLFPSLKLVFSDHLSDVPREVPFAKNLLLKCARRVFSSLCDRIVTPSKYVNGRVVRGGVNASKVTTIYNGVNVDRFRAGPASSPLLKSLGVAGPGTVVISSVSQVIPEKGIGVLIDAARIARNAGADVAFVHVGDGPAVQDYKSKIAALGLDGCFHFAGLLNLPEIAQLLRCSDVFTSPCTWREAFSLSVLEALAAGKPCIVTDAGGNTEAVTDGHNGIVVPPNDAHALASAILKLHGSPELRSSMGAVSLHRSGYFCMDRWVENTVAQYRQILGCGAEKDADRRLAAASK